MQLDYPLPTNINGYRIIDRQADGTIVVRSKNYGEQIWELSQRLIQKTSVCCICGKWFGFKTALMFKPLQQTKLNRWHKICQRCGGLE